MPSPEKTISAKLVQLPLLLKWRQMTLSDSLLSLGAADWRIWSWRGSDSDRKVRLQTLCKVCLSKSVSDNCNLPMLLLFITWDTSNLSMQSNELKIPKAIDLWTPYSSWNDLKTTNTQEPSWPMLISQQLRWYFTPPPLELNDFFNAVSVNLIPPPRLICAENASTNCDTVRTCFVLSPQANLMPPIV